jgi:hypothetical protein
MDVVAVFAGYFLGWLALAVFLGKLAFSRPEVLLATVAVWPVVFALFGLYSPRRLLSVSLAELQRGLAAAVVATLVVLAIVFETGEEVRRAYLPFLPVCCLLVCCLLTVGYGRVATRLLALYANDWLKR